MSVTVEEVAHGSLHCHLNAVLYTSRQEFT